MDAVIKQCQNLCKHLAEAQVLYCPRLWQAMVKYVIMTNSVLSKIVDPNSCGAALEATLSYLIMMQRVKNLWASSKEEDEFNVERIDLIKLVNCIKLQTLKLLTLCMLPLEEFQEALSIDFQFNQQDVEEWDIFIKNNNFTINCKENYLLLKNVDLSIIEAARSGDVSQVQVCLEQGVDPDTRDLGDLANNALFEAIKHDHLQVVKLLVQHDASLARSRQAKGWQPVHSAAFYGRFDALKFLVNVAGGDVLAKDKEGNTPLHYACHEGQLQLAKWLVEEKDVSVKITNNFKNTPLHLAALEGHLDTLKWLVEEKDANIYAVDFKHSLPLHLASWKGHLEVVKWFVNVRGMDVNLVKERNRTSLHLAAMGGNLALVKWLVENQGMDVTAVDSQNFSALHLAVTGGHLEIVSWLLDQWRMSVAEKDKVMLINLARNCNAFTIRDWLTERYVSSTSLIINA